MTMKQKVMIVEDDIDVQNILTATLSDDFELSHYYDGQDIVERIENEQPDLVVLDILMPLEMAVIFARQLKLTPKQTKLKY